MRRDIGDDEALLRALKVEPAGVVAREPMAGGIAGARLARLTIREGTSGTAACYSYRVLKWLEPESGWLGALSGDTLLREVRLWSRGVLADLPAGIATGALAWSETAGDATSGGKVAALKGRRTDGRAYAVRPYKALPMRQHGARGAKESAGPTLGALLLRDERGHLVRDPLRTPPGHLPALVGALLDALAQLHARYWCDARLRDPELGLAPPEAALLLTAPDALANRVASGDTDPYLPLALAGWEAFFQLAAPEDAETLRGVLANPAPVLEALADLPWTLAHGDVWGPNIGFLSATWRAPRRGTRVLLLDWALTTAGPATYDALWLCGTWHALVPVRVLAAYRARLARHLAARDVSLAPEVWRRLADAGYLRTVLTCGEALGRAAAEARMGAPRRRAEARVRWWAARGARAARSLMSWKGRGSGAIAGLRP